MTRARLLTGLVALSGAFSALATPAYAEFESRNEADKGTGEFFQVKIAVNSSNNITCAEAEEEGSTSVGWSINAGGKEVKKASNIDFKVEKWGKCIDKIGLEKEPTKISECEMEMAQPKEEVQVKIRIVKTCTIEIAESCEVKLGAQQLKVFEVDTAGGALEGEKEKEKEKAGESTGFSAQISNMTTEAPKECGVLGIKGSKTATMEGVGVLQQAQNPAPALVFTMDMTGNFNESGGENQTTPPFFEFPSAGGTSKWECAKGKFTGRLSSRAPSIATTPAYENCKETGAEGMPVATLVVTNCTWEYRLVGRLGPGNYIGTAQLKGATCEFKLTANECEFLMKGQGPAHFSVGFLNMGTGLIVAHILLSPFEYKTGVVTRCNGSFTANKNGRGGFSVGSLLLNNVNVPA